MKTSAQRMKDMWEEAARLKKEIEEMEKKRRKKD